MVRRAHEERFAPPESNLGAAVLVVLADLAPLDRERAAEISFMSRSVW